MHTIDSKPIMGIPRTAEHDQSFNFEYPDLENPKNYNSKADKPVMTELQCAQYFLKRLEQTCALIDLYPKQLA